MMATQALGNALKTNMSKQPSMTAGETYMQSVEPTLKELKGAEEEKMKAEKEKAIFTGESESRRQQALSKATEAEATAMREDPARAQYEGLIQEKSKAEFIPTQENAKDMAALFSLMNVIGFAIGAGGKQHAQQAMSAMNGMLEGHQKGRDDLYRQQRNIFETNQKQLDKKIDDLFKFMQENTKLYARDKVAAEQNANAKFAEEGAGFLKTYYEKYGPGPALEYMKQIVKAKEHAADLTDKEKTRAENERFRLQQADIQAEAKKEAQKSSYEYVTKDGKTYAINKNNPKDIQEVNVDLGGATKVGVQPKGGAGSSQQQFENITSADIGNAYFRINELLKESKDNKIPEGSKFLRDKGVQSGVIDAYKNWLVNRSLPPDLQQTDAALLGMAFDVVAARSFGRSAGVTDAKIAQVVRQLPVEGDSESTKQSKMRMLLNQLEEPNKLLPKEKRKDGAEYMTSPISQSLYSSYAGTSKSEKDPVTGYPKFNDKGWELHSDSQGGYAYVSPNGKDYEEIE